MYYIHQLLHQIENTMLFLTVPEYVFRVGQLTAPGRCYIRIPECVGCLFSILEIVWLSTDCFAIRYYKDIHTPMEWQLEDFGSLRVLLDEID